MSKTSYLKSGRQSKRAAAEWGRPGQAVATGTATASYALAICRALHAEGFLHRISFISHDSPMTCILLIFSKKQPYFTDEEAEV